MVSLTENPAWSEAMAMRGLVDGMVMAFLRLNPPRLYMMRPRLPSPARFARFKTLAAFRRTRNSGECRESGGQGAALPMTSFATFRGDQQGEAMRLPRSVFAVILVVLGSW